MVEFLKSFQGYFFFGIHDKKVKPHKIVPNSYIKSLKKNEVYKEAKNERFYKTTKNQKEFDRF